MENFKRIYIIYIGIYNFTKKKKILPTTQVNKI